MHTFVRDTDFIARIGGDEFALVLPETTRGDAETICDQLKKALADCSFEWQSEDNVLLKPSMGIASFPMDATNGDDLVVSADNALYKTKKRQS